MAAGDWVIVSYTGGDRSTVHIQVAKRYGDGWVPAFLDYHEGERVARIRTSETGKHRVWLRVDGVVTEAGAVTLG